MSAADEENFLQRWLRRKSEAGETTGTASDDAVPDIADEEAVTAALDERVPVEGAAGELAPPADDADASDGNLVDQAADEETERGITDADLPALEDLDQDSDYSMFLASGISPDKRKAALRQLFSSPKFNITDGLDDYCEDFTKFEPLGDIVTADMRHHAERLLRKALEAGETDDADEADAAVAAAEPTDSETDLAETDLAETDLAETDLAETDLAEQPAPESGSRQDPAATAAPRPDDSDQNSAPDDEPERNRDKKKNSMNKGEQKNA